MILGRWRGRRASSLIVETGVALVSLTRGIDFLPGDDDATANLGRVASIIPLSVLGALYLAGSVAVLAAMVGQWGWLAINGHIFLSGVFVFNGIGLFLEIGFASGFRVWAALLTFGLVIHGGFILSIVNVISTHEGEIPPEEL